MKTGIFSVFLGLTIALGASTVHAAMITLGFEPAVQVVPLSQPVAVDVVISGLEDRTAPSVRAFGLDVSFDQTILDPIDVVFGPFLGDRDLVEALTSVAFLPGVVDFAELSLLLPSDLDALQPDTFTLATLSFDTSGLGTSPLIFTQVNVFEAFADSLEVDPGSGAVSVVPEPGTLLLFGSGLAGLGLSARRRYQQR